MAKRKAKKSRTAIKRKSSRPKKPAKLPKDAIALVVVMHAKPGQELLLQAELTALVRPTRNEEGCLLYDLHRSTDVSGDFLFMKFGPAAKLRRPQTNSPFFALERPQGHPAGLARINLLEENCLALGACNKNSLKSVSHFPKAHFTSPRLTSGQATIKEPISKCAGFF